LADGEPLFRSAGRGFGTDRGDAPESVVASNNSATDRFSSSPLIESLLQCPAGVAVTPVLCDDGCDSGGPTSPSPMNSTRFLSLAGVLLCLSSCCGNDCSRDPDPSALELAYPASTCEVPSMMPSRCHDAVSWRVFNSIARFRQSDRLSELLSRDVSMETCLMSRPGDPEPSRAFQSQTRKFESFSRLVSRESGPLPTES